MQLGIATAIPAYTTTLQHYTKLSYKRPYHRPIDGFFVCCKMTMKEKKKMKKKKAGFLLLLELQKKKKKKKPQKNAFFMTFLSKANQQCFSAMAVAVPVPYITNHQHDDV